MYSSSNNKNFYNIFFDNFNIILKEILINHRFSKNIKTENNNYVSSTSKNVLRPETINLKLQLKCLTHKTQIVPNFQRKMSKEIKKKQRNINDNKIILVLKALIFFNNSKFFFK